jgi:hypothetical protein
MGNIYSKWTDTHSAGGIIASNLSRQHRYPKKQRKKTDRCHAALLGYV